MCLSWDGPFQQFTPRASSIAGFFLGRLEQLLVNPLGHNSLSLLLLTVCIVDSDPFASKVRGSMDEKMRTAGKKDYPTLSAANPEFVSQEDRTARFVSLSSGARGPTVFPETEDAYQRQQKRWKETDCTRVRPCVGVVSTGQFYNCEAPVVFYATCEKPLSSQVTIAISRAQLHACMIAPK